MEQTDRKKRVCQGGVGLAALMFSLLGIVLAWPRERLLMEAAHPITKVDDRTEFCWISDHQFLLVTTETMGEYVWGPKHRAVWRAWKGSVDLFDTTLRKKTHLPALTDLLLRTTVFPTRNPTGFAASPDGSRILWDNYYVEHGRPWSHVARLDGTHYRKLNLSRSQDSLFLDSHRLVQTLLGEPAMIVCDLEYPTRDHIYPKLAEARTALAQDAVQKPVFRDLSASDRSEREGYVQIDTYRTEDRLEVTLAYPAEELYIQKPIQTRTFPLPEGTTMTYPAGEVSSDQHAILYHLQGSRTAPLFTWLHRLFPRFSPKPTLTESLWISRIDGEGMGELGHVPTSLNEDGWHIDLLQQVQWLPDGKQISFVYRGTLYTLPAVFRK